MKRITEKFLEWILNPEWSDDILGDLEELYDQNLERSAAYAEYKFFIQGLLLLRPSLIRKFDLLPNNNTTMFRNYLKTGIRSLMRNKLSASINVIGLALGLSVFLLLTEYVHFESTYDSHLETSEQLYRVTTTTMPNGQPELRDAMSSYLVGRELYEAIPEITGFTVSKLFDPGMVFRIGENVLQENKVISADSNFFRLFPYKVLAGNPENFLSEPGQIVLTQTKAEEYFGSIENAIGQSIELPDAFDRQFAVSGVVQDIPENTHYKFEIAISDPSTKDLEDFENWNYNNHYVYVLLDEPEAANNLQDKLDAVHFKIHNHNKARWELGKVTDIHLSSNHTFEPEATGSKTAVNFMKYIAFFILVIAWINYINLSTARAMDRAKEVGIRKVSGAYKSQLIGQFLTEAFIVNLGAAILAIAITSMAAPFFNFLSGTTIIGDIWQMDLILRNALIFFLLGTILSGFYPALVLSRYRPNEVLKGRFSQSGKGVFMRKSLVTVQFAASIILISGTLIVRQQVEYMMNQDLGIDTEQIISFRPPEVYDEETAYRSDLFKEKLMEHSAIVSIGKTSNVPGGNAADINSTTSTIWMEGEPEPFKGTTYMMVIDDGFIPTLNMELIQGRNFDRNRPSDSLSLMVNEAFLNNFGGIPPADAIGKTLSFGEDTEKYTIIGIANDFNRTSLKAEVEPTIYFPFLYLDYFVMKLSADQIDGGLLHLEKTWDEFYADMPLDYIFMDRRFASLYEEDQRLGNIFLYFTIIAILISLMGLLGLATYMAAQRTKEVGIRKVMGASVLQVIGLFVGDFLKLLLLAAFISIPIVYYFMESWLENYAFRIDFPWFISVAGALIVTLFAITTIVFQVRKVAITQPADTLKYE